MLSPACAKETRCVETCPPDVQDRDTPVADRLVSDESREKNVRKQESLGRMFVSHRGVQSMAHESAYHSLVLAFTSFFGKPRIL